MAITDEIPKSRLTLTYRTTVRGEPEDVTLPLRLLILGDLSGGTSKDRKLDLDQRQIRGLDGKNLDQVIGDMGMSLKLTVANKIDSDRGGGEMQVELPIKSMKSFSPAEVGTNVPKIKALLLLKKLLLEVQANLDNRKEFRKLLRALAQDKNAIEALSKELAGFDTFKLPQAKKAEG
jgi:type VI secretion system protein ImpB